MKAFIIHLPKSDKSLSIASELKLQLDSMFDVELSIGTDRYEAWNKYINSELTINDVTRFGGGYIDSEIGTFFSHFNLWNKCLELNKSILILEHDAELVKDLDLNVLTNFKGDILNLGIPNWGTRVWEGKGLIEREVCNNFHNIHNYREGCQCNTPWLFGAHAYVVTPSGAKKLVDSAFKDGILPADTYLRQEVVDIADYLPHSFKQKETFSMIQINKIYDNQIVDEWDY